jgi:hypothetical protein
MAEAWLSCLQKMDLFGKDYDVAAILSLILRRCKWGFDFDDLNGPNAARTNQIWNNYSEQGDNHFNY